MFHLKKIKAHFIFLWLISVLYTSNNFQSYIISMKTICMLDFFMAVK